MTSQTPLTLPTKVSLARQLTVKQIRDAISRNQPEYANWSQTANKESLLRRATLKTLIRAKLVHYEELNDASNSSEISKLTRVLEILQSQEQPTVSLTQSTSSSTVAHVTVSKSQQMLQLHLEVLKAAGLISDEEKARINSFWVLCHQSDRDSDGENVFDALNQENFDQEKGDIVRLSDGHCYSKESMREFLQTGTVSTRTGRPILPLSQQNITDKDYQILELAVPTPAQIGDARRRQLRLNGAQLRAGDIEQWRAGDRSIQALPDFAYYLTDINERQRLARELGTAIENLEPALDPTITVQPLQTMANVPQNAVPAPPIQIAAVASQPFVYISAGEDYSLGLLDDGSVVGWGDNSFGQAKDGQALATNGRKFIAISAGRYHSLGLLNNSSVVGWGRNQYGQAKDGQALATNGRKFIAISAGWYHSLGLLDDGSVVGWGDNRYGQAKDGQALATNGRKFIAISAGLNYSLGLLDDGSVVGWGDNRDGQAKDGQALASNGRKFIAISAGGYHSLGLLDDGSVVGWGRNQYGQAKDGQALATNGRKFTAISAGYFYSLGLLNDGSVVGWGDNRDGKAKDGQALATNGRKFTAISAFRDHSLGLRDGSVVGWGKNDRGQADRR